MRHTAPQKSTALQCSAVQNNLLLGPSCKMTEPADSGFALAAAWRSVRLFVASISQHYI
jgi:hypothetical protein